MHSSHSLLLPPQLLLLLLATTDPAGALTEEDKRLIVDAHNSYRAQTNPPAANMLKMMWDEDLAVFAKAYAEHCVWAHNPNRGWRGENLFAITGDSMDVQMAVAEWHRESDYYNFTTGACQSGQMCGHYTQVVWAKTDRVGCDSHLCPKLQNVEDSNVHFLVCNYVPPGNVIGQKLYEVGPPCSACPLGYHCEQSLCEPTRDPEEPQDLPYMVTGAQTPLATEASSSSEMGAPSSLATEAPSFLLTEVSASLATKALPTLQTEVPSSLATKDPPSMATETRSSLTTNDPSFMATEALPFLTEVPSLLETHGLFSLDERPVTFPKSTHTPFSKSADKAANRANGPYVNPEESLYSKMFLIGTQQPLSQAQTEAGVPHELPPPSEVLVSVSPTQDEAAEKQVTFIHVGPTSSRSLPNSPNTSTTANTLGGRTLGLQSTVSGADLPGGSVTESENLSPTGPNPAGLSPVGPSPARPNPAKPNPAGPSPAGPSPAEPNPAMPTPARPNPNPAMPTPARPNPNPAMPTPARPNPAKPNPTGSIPARPNPVEQNPSQPNPAELNPLRPNWAEPNPASTSPEGPSLVGLNPAEAGLEELTPEEPEELNPAELEEQNPEDLELLEPDEPKMEEPNAEDPNAEEPNAELPNAEDPNAEEPNAELPNIEEPNAEMPNAEHPSAEDPNAEEAPKPTKWKPTKPMLHLKPFKVNSATRCVWSPFLGLLLLLPLVLTGIF
ncbi:PREDICTED: peptidase inhibitor 16 [Chrysochloris asiatica]|uniref:Peptidase inhibitor 16 n=1 Tax=Chrysochloris asiatica TaxID=185453 RepID=A0A9B0T9X6_CHRAS|nr:PREDICTED: peptidase inhibitor 16 [Chrysochloris asiatica]